MSAETSLKNVKMSGGTPGIKKLSQESGVSLAGISKTTSFSISNTVLFFLFPSPVNVPLKSWVIFFFYYFFFFNRLVRAMCASFQLATTHASDLDALHTNICSFALPMFAF